MKKLILAAAGSVALMSGAAYAGGCQHGERLASESKESLVLAAVDETEAQRLERLAALEAQAMNEQLLPAPVIHN